MKIEKSLNHNKVALLVLSFDGYDDLGRYASIYLTKIGQTVVSINTL